MNMHKNRTTRGLELERKHDASYKKRLIGKSHKDGRVISNVEWIGNSVYGCVKIFWDNGEDQLFSSHSGFKPTNEDFRHMGILV